MAYFGSLFKVLKQRMANKGMNSVLVFLENRRALAISKNEFELQIHHSYSPLQSSHHHLYSEKCDLEQRLGLSLHNTASVNCGE